MYAGKIEKSNQPSILQSFSQVKKSIHSEEMGMFEGDVSQQAVRAKIYSKIEQITAPLQKIACFNIDMWMFYLKPTGAVKV